MSLEITSKDIKLTDQDYFDFVSGLWTGKKAPFAEAVVIRNTNFLNNGHIDYRNIAVLKVEAKQLEKRKLEEGDIIIERSGGGPKQPVGRVVYFDNNTNANFSFSNFTSVIRVKNKNSIDSKFVFYFLHNFYLEGRTESLQRRTTGIRNLDFNSYKNSIVFPSSLIKDQKQIIYILATIEESISSTEHQISKLKDLKRSILKHLFTYGLNNKRTRMSQIGEIPENWSIKKLGDLVKLSSGGTPSRKIENFWLNGTIPWVKTTEINYSKIKITEEKITEEGLRNSSAKIFPKGTLLMAMYGQGVTRGRVGILDIDAATNQACAALIGNEIISKYLFHYLTFTYEKVRQLGHGANQKNLNSSLIKSIEVPICEEAEMRRIISILDLVDEKIEYTERKLLILSKLFKNLLYELMTGLRKLNSINVEEYSKKEKKQNKVVSPYFKRAVLAAYILDVSQNDSNLNKTKFQKLLFSIENYASLDLVSNYHAHEAGPHDNAMMYSVDQQLSKQKWFQSKKSGNEIKYVPLQNKDKYKRYFESYWGSYKANIDYILDIFKKLDYMQSEIVATLYAVWNNLLLQKDNVNDQEIMTGFYNWHPAKKKYPEDRLIKALSWMREKKFIPRGQGKIIT